MNILTQIKAFDSDKIIQIWMRFEKFKIDDTSHIRDKVAYLCSILPHYGINPHNVPKVKPKVLKSLLYLKKKKKTLELEYAVGWKLLIT